MKSTTLCVGTRNVVRLLCNGWKIREHKDLSRCLFRMENRKDRKPKMIYRDILRSVFYDLEINKLITTAKVHRSKKNNREIGRTYRATVAAYSI